jgi:Ca2+-binding EF-hand superfamily protein
MLYRTLLIASALSLGGFVASADARGHGMGKMPGFETLDLNKDGKIDLEEARAALPNRLTGADANGDGTITLDELKAHMTAENQRKMQDRAARMMERLDTDKDGKLSPEELAAMSERGQERFARMFDRLDRDSDGAISKAEYDRMVERMDRRGDGKGQRHGKMGGN